MLSTQLFLRTLRQGACGLWAIHIAALDSDRTVDACQARTAVCHIAYAHDVELDDIAQAFAWHGRQRSRYWRPEIDRRHADLLVGAAYAINYERLERHAHGLSIDGAAYPRPNA
jgi:hypothetical protein